MSQVRRRQVTEVVVQEERVKIEYLKGRKTYFGYCSGDVAGTVGSNFLCGKKGILLLCIW